MTNVEKMSQLKTYLQKNAGLSFVEARDVVDGMVNSEYMYDCDNILNALKNAVKLKNAVSSVSDSDKADIIFRTLNKIEQQAKNSQQTKNSQQPISIPQKPDETKKEVSTDGCPSLGKEPVDCSEKKDYIKQTLIFHPDKNPKCIEDSTLKFQALQNNTTCHFD